MMAFELLEPRSLKDAIALIDPDDPEVRPIAGGTALMLMMKAGVFRPRRLVSLRKLGDAFNRIAAAPAGDLIIGAMAPLSALEQSPAIAHGAAVIVRGLPSTASIARLSGSVIVSLKKIRMRMSSDGLAISIEGTSIVTVRRCPPVTFSTTELRTFAALKLYVRPSEPRMSASAT